MAVAFPTIAIAQTSSRMTAPNVSVVQFGNGYEQRVPIGINFIRDKWAISWEGLTRSEMVTIRGFLESMAYGDYTSWVTPFDDSTKKFVLDGEWSVQDSGGNIYTVSANLRQVYDV